MSIVLVEMTYLIERGRLAPEPFERLIVSTLQDDGAYVIADLNRETAIALRAVPRAVVSDMPYRIIVATALHLGLPLNSRDAAIRSANVVPLIW